MYHWGYLLFCGISFCGGTHPVGAFSNTVDLLVDFRPVVIAELTGTRDAVLDSAGMPCPNASHLPQPLVGLARELLCSPAEGDTYIYGTIKETIKKCTYMHTSIKITQNTQPLHYNTVLAVSQLLTLESFTLCDTYDINHLVLIEYILDWDGFFKMFHCPIHLHMR